MSEPLTTAREALARHDAFYKTCAHIREDPEWGYLRAAFAEIDRLATLAARADEEDTRAWTRGFVSAIAYHCEGVDEEEALRSTSLYSGPDAIAAGAEEEDVNRILRRHHGRWPIEVVASRRKS